MCLPVVFIPIMHLMYYPCIVGASWGTELGGTVGVVSNIQGVVASTYTITHQIIDLIV